MLLHATDGPGTTSNHTYRCGSGCRADIISCPLPEGTETSPLTEESVYGLGNREDSLVQRAIHAGRVQTYPAAIDLVRRLRAVGLKMAGADVVVSDLGELIGERGA